jgi:hypothetical protein
LGFKTDILASADKGIAGKIHLDSSAKHIIKNKYPNVTWFKKPKGTN